MTRPIPWVPQECTLPTAEQPIRLAEFDTLFAQFVTHAERPGPTHLRLLLAGPADLAATVQDLADRESRCCTFFTFTITSVRTGHVRLDIEVPAAHTAVIDALAAQAEPGQAQ